MKSRIPQRLTKLAQWPSSTGTNFYDWKFKIFSSHYNGVKFEFIDPIDKNLLCWQCNAYANEPHHCLSCHSLFCEECTDLNICPGCNKLSEYIPDRRSNNLIQHLRVWCPNCRVAGLGCNWKGELRNVPNHRMECPQELISCSYRIVGCEARIQRNELTNHEKEDRQTHLNLAMKNVVSMVKMIQELRERIEELETAVEELQEKTGNL